MAQLNFNALAPQSGPQGFYQGFEQGQKEKVASEMNQIKLEELRRDRDEMVQLQEKLKSLGQDPDVSKFLDTLAQTGKPEYVKMAIEGKQKIKDLDAYAKLGTIEPVTAAPAMPTGAPALGAPALRMPQAPAPTNMLGSGTFGMGAEPAAAAPVNAMAPAPAAAAPVNALAAQPGADLIAPTQQRIKQLLDFARTNPRMAAQAMSEARILQDQLELYSKRGQNEPPDAVMMRQLGYPLTQAGYQAFRDAQRQERMLSPAEEAQRVRIATASRPPAQPRPEQAPVAVVDPATGKQVYVTREEALRNRMSPAAAMEALPPKEIQKREATYPQATSSVKGFEFKSDSFIKELIKLRDDPGLAQITGPVYGRTPSVSREGSRAQSLYDKIFAKGGFQALQDMREASKTGGALGNVSNKEGERLEKSVVGGLDRTQNIKDVQQGINDLIDDIEGSKLRVREAYDMTYAYKTGTAAGTPPQLTPQDKEALNWANSNPNDPRAAQIKQRLKVQ